MPLNNFVLDALDRVLSWDLPDDSGLTAVTDQAGLLAGIDPEEIVGVDLD